MNCAFPGCGNQTRAKSFGETKCFHGICPTEDREVLRCWKEATEHYRYCHYHRMILTGQCLPAVLSAYTPDLQQKILVAHKKFNQQFSDKKERGL